MDYAIGKSGELVESTYGYPESWIDLSGKYQGENPREGTVVREDITLSELADFLVLYVVPRYGLEPGMGVCMPQERDKMIADLKEKNPGIADKPYCTGLVRIPWNKVLFPPESRGSDWYPFDE